MTEFRCANGAFIWLGFVQRNCGLVLVVDVGDEWGGWGMRCHIPETKTKWLLVSWVVLAPVLINS